MTAAIPPTPMSIRAHVVELLQQQLGDGEIDLDADFNAALGLDWLGRIELTEALEEAYRVTIDDDELASASTPGRVADLVIRALGLDPDYEED